MTEERSVIPYQPATPITKNAKDSNKRTIELDKCGSDIDTMVKIYILFEWRKI